MKFLLVGANFNNKGAQAMLFITVSELMDRFRDPEILFLTSEPARDGYTFRWFYDFNGWEMAKGGGYAAKAMARVLYWKIKRGKKGSYRDAFAFLKELKTVDAMIDISGYALSSQRGLRRSVNYLNQIRVARGLHIPCFIMPQSIGPFDYGKDQARMDRMLQENLPYPVVICPREKDGYDLLRKMGLKNARLSCDLVLQNRGIKEKNIFRGRAHKMSLPALEEGERVAIIPNMRNFEFGSQDKLIRLYTEIIKKLRSLDRKVFLVRHSGEDGEACRLIYEALDDRDGVMVLEQDLDCIEFNALITSFDYVIGSRFHAIVHSLKNAVPAIVLGWAAKYEELLKLFGQERYMFDVRHEIRTDEVLAAIGKMDKNWQAERALIRERLPQYQKENCFDILSRYFAGGKGTNRRQKDPDSGGKGKKQEQKQEQKQEKQE